MAEAGRISVVVTSSGEMPLQCGNQLIQVACRGFPHLVDIYITVIMGDDVAHSPHAAEWQVGKQGLRLWREPAGGFANDLEAAEDCILLFHVGHEGLPADCVKIHANGQRGIEDVPQQCGLFFNGHKPGWNVRGSRRGEWGCDCAPQRGGSQHFRMAGADFHATGTVRGRLYGIDWYPGLVLDDSADAITGEIYQVCPGLLESLDAFEGGEYRRVRAVVALPEAAPLSAWLWEWLGPCDENQRIVSGDWLVR